ncbi:yjeF N-terminal region [Litoreibacter ascidiaceicola]|uniref:NAD(P)H-hydrate epimerase n=1 Tax=Litoreibacter ascidiaceicola TaxID=1486859 RepID=A0A1M4SW28_9RHOB|nr:yjeF N-terminal region [Litoreibacter ascidiaceicola]
MKTSDQTGSSETITSDEMRALEQAAIASGRVTGLELMERAGKGVVEAIFEEWPELVKDKRRAVVLCGPGNNGGDGFVVARLLEKAGWGVETFLYGDAKKLPPDARVNYELWLGRGGVSKIEVCYSYRWASHPVVVDALFGIGMNRPLPDELRNILMATLNCRRVAVDIPSYVSSDTGDLMCPWPHYTGQNQLTVTFHRPKAGHVMADGAQVCGKVVVKDIGL